jgi:competence protein ComEA
MVIRHVEAVSDRARLRLRMPRRGFVPTVADLAGPVHDGAGPASVWPVSGGAVSGGGAASGGGPEPDGPGVTLGEPGSVPEKQAGPGCRCEPARQRTVRLPTALIGARWGPSRAAVLGVIIVVALGSALLGLRVIWAQSHSGGTVLAPRGDSPTSATVVRSGAGSDGSADPLGNGSPTPAPPAREGRASVVVHVVGQVRRPGVVKVPVGSRVCEAIAAAGGPTRAADTGRVNLARVVVDGEQVRVPAPGEAVESSSVPTGSAPGRPGGVKVPLNTADVATLDALPGIGPVLAQRIVDWRTEHGRFATVDELGEVSGIGDKLLAAVRPLVTT